LKKLAGIHIDYICSTHGPVWHKYVDKVISLYDRMSKYETDPGLVICYGTMYGNTERMAEQIARSASLAGVKDIRLYNVSKTHHSYILQDIFRFRGLIVGAPTYNAGLYHEMDVLLQEVAEEVAGAPALTRRWRREMQGSVRIGPRPMTVSRSSSVRAAKGTSTRTPSASATFHIQPMPKMPQLLTAPSRMVRDSSGTSAASSRTTPA